MQQGGQLAGKRSAAYRYNINPHKTPPKSIIIIF